MRSGAAAMLLGGAITPPTLAAVTQHMEYAGKVTQGGTAQLAAIEVRGKVTKIELLLDRVRATCKQGSTTVTFFALDLPVKHHAFYANRHHMAFKGKFSRTYRDVRGTASLSGNLARYTGCTTGTVDWSARAVHRS